MAPGNRTRIVPDCHSLSLVLPYTAAQVRMSDLREAASETHAISPRGGGIGRKVTVALAERPRQGNCYSPPDFRLIAEESCRHSDRYNDPKCRQSPHRCRRP